jgi:hypothetical protein
MKRIPHSPSGAWPRLMRADTAAAYLDEKSVEAFLRAVGSLYPEPITLSGKGSRWLKDSLDRAIDRLSGPAATVRDIADAMS